MNCKCGQPLIAKNSKISGKCLDCRDEGYYKNLRSNGNKKME